MNGFFCATWTLRLRVAESALKSDVVVSEEIVRSDGSQIAVIVHAKFDGRPYPVTGSPIVDAIAYARVGRDTILGTGTKDGRRLAHLDLFHIRRRPRDRDWDRGL